ncbi:hypothetical protein L596_004774 [Steinernema carpocapsae]|uniref:Uncharacterized protein n=1 Tax=Steinernema carpocapsae TaxID=34508 RepID=A0A4V6I891_STECR|nr:hypothetical protein L596_004774 [Steinernema carpocapsae]
MWRANDANRYTARVGRFLMNDQALNPEQIEDSRAGSPVKTTALVRFQSVAIIIVGSGVVHSLPTVNSQPTWTGRRTNQLDSKTDRRATASTTTCGRESVDGDHRLLQPRTVARGRSSSPAQYRPPAEAREPRERHAAKAKPKERTDVRLNMNHRSPHAHNTLFTTRGTPSGQRLRLPLIIQLRLVFARSHASESQAPPDFPSLGLPSESVLVFPLC